MRKLSCLVVALAAALAASACAPPPVPQARTGSGAPAEAPRQAAAQPAASGLTPVRFGWGKQVSDAGYFLLPELGKKYGLDIDLVPFRRYPEALTALATGEVELSHVGYPQISFILEQGIRNAKVIAGQVDGGTNLTMHNDVPVAEWTDLLGKKIGIFPGGPGDLNFRSSLGRHNLDVSRVEVVKLTAPGPQLYQALKTREIDGFVAWEPFQATPYVEGYAYYAPLDIMDNPTRGVNGVIAVNTDWAAKNPDTVVKFLQAVLDGQRHMLENKDEWAQVTAEQLGIPIEVTRESIKHFDLPPNLELHQREAQEMSRLMKEYAMAQKDWSAEIPTVLDYSYLERASGKPASELGKD